MKAAVTMAMSTQQMKNQATSSCAVLMALMTQIFHRLRQSMQTAKKSEKFKLSSPMVDRIRQLFWDNTENNLE